MKTGRQELQNYTTQQSGLKYNITAIIVMHERKQWPLLILPYENEYYTHNPQKHDPFEEIFKLFETIKIFT